MRVFGRCGAGAFAGAALIEDELRHAFHLASIGTIPEIRESFYAVSRERKIKHPAVAAVLSTASSG